MPKLVLGYQQKAMFRLKPGRGTGTSLSIASLNGAYCKWLWQINQIMITKSLQMELMKQYRMENSCSNTWYSVEVLDQATWTTWLTCYKKFIAEIWQRKSGNSKLMVSDFENIINNYYTYLMYSVLHEIFVTLQICESVAKKVSQKFAAPKIKRRYTEN